MPVLEAKPESAVEAPVEKKGTLLIIDDEDSPRISLEMILKHDYNILSASNGPSAIKLAQENSVDVAISDIRMPGMSGIELLERLKFIDPSIEVVMLTAYETTETIRKALRLRACDYINKPYDVSAMRAAVASAMQRRVINGQVRDDTRQLEALARELRHQQMEEQMAQTRGDIYASIIHDMKGPLTVIGGFVQLMEQRIGNAAQLEGEDLAFVRERLGTIARQAKNCAEISKRYASILRRDGSAGSQIALDQLLHDANNLLRVHPSRDAHDFHIDPISKHFAVRMNATDFIQITQNLVVNAFQCSRDKHVVRVSGEVIHDPLDLSTLRDRENVRVLNIENFRNEPPIVRVEVRDSGPGIPAEVFPRIFQPYFTTKAAMQGTGLGLSIVQRLVREAGGILHVATEPGKGTCFTLYAPAMQLAETA